MSINTELLEQIDEALGDATSPSLTSEDSTNDIYEAYVFSLVLVAAKNENGEFSFTNMRGDAPNTMLFRTAPGTIYGGTHAYCHAILRFGGKPFLELHQGIYVRGQSKVKHELDVSVIWHDEATTCRENRVDPRHSRTLIAAECKMYQKASLSIKLGREFIGYSSELRGVSTCFVANKEATTLERLLIAHKKNRILRVVPSNMARVNQLIAVFQKAFQEFKSRD